LAKPFVGQGFAGQVDLEGGIASGGFGSNAWWNALFL
jgi:hypothetical protein